jgi:TP53 regulating kinase-like protein
LYKIRIKKQYRHPKIDQRLRVERTINEARILAKLISIGIPVPCLYEADTKNATIVMEYIDGMAVKDIIPGKKEDLRTLFFGIGHDVAKMHEAGIIHGDLTTSNLLMEKKKSPIKKDVKFIDFGLSSYSESTEDKGVDLHLFKRVITSTHADHFDDIYPPFISGYKKFHGKHNDMNSCLEILAKIDEIETRGRYIEKRF